MDDTAHMYVYNYLYYLCIYLVVFHINFYKIFDLDLFVHLFFYYPYIKIHYITYI